MGKVIDFLKYKQNRERIFIGDKCWFRDYNDKEILVTISHIWVEATGHNVNYCRISDVDKYHFGDNYGMRIIGKVFVSKIKENLNELQKR